MPTTVRMKTAGLYTGHRAQKEGSYMEEIYLVSMYDSHATPTTSWVYGVYANREHAQARIEKLAALYVAELQHEGYQPTVNNVDSRVCIVAPGYYDHPRVISITCQPMPVIDD